MMSEASIAPVWREIKAPGLMEAIGPLLAARSEAGWLYGLRTDPRHVNPRGVIHGGTLTALADHAMSLAAWEAAGRQPVVTVHMDAKFITAAKAGDFLEASASVLEMKGTLIFMEAMVACEGRAVMKASALMKILKPRPSTGGAEAAGGTQPSSD